MEVILQNDFPSLGYVGDKVRVANGYARNFLLPRGIAIEATSRNERQVTHLLTAIHKKRIRLRGEAEEYSKKVEAVALEFKLKVGDGGKTFGAVTSKDVEAALKANGLDIIRKQIRLSEPLRKAGEYKIPVKLHSEVTCTVTVQVVLDRPVIAAEATDDKGRKGRGRRGSRAEASSDADAAAAADESDSSKSAANPEADAEA